MSMSPVDYILALSAVEQLLELITRWVSHDLDKMTPDDRQLVTEKTKELHARAQAVLDLLK